MKLGTIINNLINGKYDTDMAEIIGTEVETVPFTYVAVKMTEEGKKHFKDIFDLPVLEIEIKDEVYITVNSGKLIKKINLFLMASAGYINDSYFKKWFILD